MFFQLHSSVELYVRLRSRYDFQIGLASAYFERQLKRWVFKEVLLYVLSWEPMLKTLKLSSLAIKQHLFPYHDEQNHVDIRKTFCLVHVFIIEWIMQAYDIKLRLCNRFDVWWKDNKYLRSQKFFLLHWFFWIPMS